MADDGLAISIEGRRGDWPGGTRTLTPRAPSREPNGTFWFGAELNPVGDQVWFRIAAEDIGRMPPETSTDRGRCLIDPGGRRRLRGAPTDHGRWPTGTFWPASKTPCYADRK